MTHDIDSAGRSRSNPGAPDQVDRILVAVCVGLWLAALGAGVAAVVALVGLAGGDSTASAESDTPWLLYAVIGVSAAVIVGAIPLLVRARRASSEPSSVAPASEGRPTETRASNPVPAAQRLEPFGAPVLRRTAIPAAVSRVGFPTAAVDQVWLRCTVIIAGAMGAAMTGIGVGTYLLASDGEATAWVLFGLAGMVTVLSPVVPWYFLRQLRTVLDAPGRVAN